MIKTFPFPAVNREVDFYQLEVRTKDPKKLIEALPKIREAMENGEVCGFDVCMWEIVKKLKPLKEELNNGKEGKEA